MIQAPTDTVIGFQSNIGGGELQIAQARAAASAGQQMTEIVEALRQIVGELRSAKPEKGRIERTLDWMRTNAAPDAIVCIVANLATLALLRAA